MTDLDPIRSDDPPPAPLPAPHEHGRIARAVHTWLDRAPRRTYVYERRAMLARETLLAVLTALVTVRDLRGGIATSLSLAWRAQ